MLYRKSPLCKEILFIVLLYAFGVGVRLIPRIGLDPWLLTFAADIWYRLCMAQYLIDNGQLPVWDIRYAAYGHVPTWYTPGALYFFAFLQKITSLDLPVIISRIMPWIESLVIVPFYYLCKYLYNKRIAVIASIFLSLTPCFIFWSGIGTPQGFTMFCIPITILFWISFIEEKYLLNSKWGHLVVMGTFMAINFLTHLTFFNSVIILLLIQLALIREERSRVKDFLYLLIPLGVSQLLTIWWWLPTNLYWWWTQGLSTSTAFFGGTEFLKHYGPLSAVLGHVSFVALVLIFLRGRGGPTKYFLVPLYWALFPLAESHMEVILRTVGREELVWNTMVRPIEGFRFYSFLAQPLAICFALCLNYLLEGDMLKRAKLSAFAKTAGAVILIGSLLFADMVFGFEIKKRFRYHVLSKEDIQAAQWYRESTKTSDRILADYYTAQLISGITGGRVLLGSMFPLKGAGIPYISDSWEVLFDIHTVYKSDDVKEIKSILKKYGCTHVYFSDLTLRNIEFVVNGYGDMDALKAGKFDVLVGREFSRTLLNPRHFKVDYQKDGIKILRLVDKN